MRININKHISESQLSRVGNNNFDICMSDLTIFGLFPKFELSSSYSLLIQYIPREGLLGYIFSSFRHISPNNNIELKILSENRNQLIWSKLFPWYYRLGWTIHGCYIKNERVDTFNITYTTKRGCVSESYNYKATITANVDPIQFFIYMNRDNNNKDNERALKDAITNFLQNEIKEELKYRLGNPAFSKNVGIPPLDACNKAGYAITRCEISYK